MRVPFMLPLLLQIGFGLSPVQSGSLTFVSSLGAMRDPAALAAVCCACWDSGAC